MSEEHDPTSDPDIERWWQWSLVWIAALVLGGEAGAGGGALGVMLGAVAGTAVTFVGFLVVRALSLAMAPEGSVITPPKCLHGRCEGIAEKTAPGRFEFLERGPSGDLYRCSCGGRYRLTPDHIFGASTMLLQRKGQELAFKRKRVLGPWRSLMATEVRQRLVEEEAGERESSSP